MKKRMETKEWLSTQLQQLSPADGLAYSQALEKAERTGSETLIGSGDIMSGFKLVLSGNRDYTVKSAWFGVNMEKAKKAKKATETFEVVKHLFKKCLLERGEDNHPWTADNAPLGTEQVRRMMDFDPAWTLEDFGLFFDMVADGRLQEHHGRPSRDWWRKCQEAYNELKYEAREQIAADAKKKAEADAAEKAYYISLGMDLPTAEGRMERVRTMAEFLGGKNKLTPAEREEMLNRDKKRNDGAAE